LFYPWEKCAEKMLNTIGWHSKAFLKNIALHLNMKNINSSPCLWWRPRLAQGYIHRSKAMSTSVSTWMGDCQEKPSAVNLCPFVGVNLNLWLTVDIAVFVLTKCKMNQTKLDMLENYKEQHYSYLPFNFPRTLFANDLISAISCSSSSLVSVETYYNIIYLYIYGNYALSLKGHSHEKIHMFFLVWFSREY